MDVSVDKSDILRVLAKACPVASAKSGMPITGNVLVQTVSGGVMVSATDMYLGFIGTCKAKVKAPGALAVPARRLLDIAKSMPAGDIRMAADKQAALKITSGKIRFRVVALPGEDFVELPKVDDSALSALPPKAVAQVIALTRYCISPDETRPHLNGALLEREGSVLRMAATDGHRLAKAECEVAGQGSFKMLIPKAAVSEIYRIATDSPDVDLCLGTSGSYIFAKSGDSILSAKQVDEQFPPYEKVIPKKHTRRLVASREVLVDAIKRTSIVAEKRTDGIRCTLSEGALRFECESAENGEGSEEVSVDYSGEPLTIGFSARYMLEALIAPPDDEVVLELSGELSPCVIKPSTDDRFIMVVMPMRI